MQNKKGERLLVFFLSNKTSWQAGFVCYERPKSRLIKDKALNFRGFG